MRRVALLLDLSDDEADLVIAAISATSVRFAGLQLDEVIQMAMAVGPAGGPDMSIAHEVRSDGAMYLGEPRYALSRR